ncbi:MAG: hypothetical protein V4516_10105 [Pseudomonadota bacterium]
MILPQAMAVVRRKLEGSDDGDRQMVQTLSCVRDDGLQAVEAASQNEDLDVGAKRGRDTVPHCVKPATRITAAATKEVERE